jgi:hypothetical protein
VKKVLFALFVLAVSGNAMAFTATLVAHNQVSSSGTTSTLIWNGSNATTAGGMAVGATASTATWDWNNVSNTMTSTGLYFATSHLSSSIFAPSVIGDRVVDLVLNTNADTTAASNYECREGNFLAGVGAQGCANVSTNFTPPPSTVAYNVGGNANCVVRTLAADDTSTGPPRGLFTAAAGGGCDAVAGAFDLWTIADAWNGMQGDTLIISNGIALTSPGANYMTFTVVPVPAAVWLLGSALGLLGWIRRRAMA